MKRVLVFIFILAALFLGEVAARKSYGDGFLSLLDHQLHHTRRPYINIERTWGTGEKFRLITNSLGWRDEIPNRKVTKIANSKRIVFLGDSITEAIGYNQGDSFSGIAGRILERRGIDCEVLNGGMASYSPLLEYVRLKRFLDEGFKTDMVVLLPDYSDVQDEALYSADYIFDDGNEPVKFKRLPYAYPVVCSALNSSCLLRLAARAAKDIYDSRANTAGKLAEQSRVRGNWEADEESVSGWAESGSKSLRENIIRIKNLCDKNGILLMVVIYPWPQQLYIEEDAAQYKVLRDYFHQLFAAREEFYGTKPSKTLSLYEEYIVSLCAENSIDVLNLFGEITEMKDSHSLYIGNDVHFNRAGHKFMGKRIAGALTEIF